VIAQQRGDHNRAAARFRQAIQLQPSYGPSRLLLGVSLRALGKNAEAVHELERAAKLMPKEPQAHLQLAKAYEASDDRIAAVAELQKLVELFPQEPEYRYQLGMAWTKLSGWSYQKIKQLSPDSARLQQALGREYVVQEKYDLALAAYQRAARQDPKLPEIHLATAVVLLELRRFDEALAEIDLEQKLVPESKAASETRARIQAARASSTP
jgi:Flp pilus assembly protein TadD